MVIVPESIEYILLFDQLGSYTVTRPGRFKFGGIQARFCEKLFEQVRKALDFRSFTNFLSFRTVLGSEGF